MRISQHSDKKTPASEEAGYNKYCADRALL